MGSAVVKVSELFYPNFRVWDPGKLAACFLPWEAKKVRGYMWVKMRLRMS